MSSNAVAAMAVILVSGFAGCAATARATEAPPIVSAHVYAVPDHRHAAVTIGAPAPAPTVVTGVSKTAPFWRARYR